MNDIVLVTLNASWKHASFGLRCLYANLGELQSRATIREMTIKMSTREIVDQIRSHQPRIVGLGVYIWNATQSLDVVRLLKTESPEIQVVLGGPEVSHETESQEIFHLANYTIKGEAEDLFRELCQKILTGEQPKSKFITGALPLLPQLKSPYSYYNEEDIRHRAVYVEASRGCPYKCEYCLSSLDQSVRNFPLDAFLADMQSLMDRGLRQFKFVDRTFNLSPTISAQILEFFLARIHLGLFLHFEMVPDHLPERLKELIQQFPEGSLQFEIGIQTWNPAVARNVSRRQNYDKIRDNLNFLKTQTKVHTHADLIVGLPGENEASFAHGFDELSKLAPDEIQVGILKRLKGTPIVRHDQNFEMVYSLQPPYEIQRNKDLDSGALERLARFAKYWGLIANNGRFPGFMFHLREAFRNGASLYQLFAEFSEALFTKYQRTFGLTPENLAVDAEEFLIRRLGLDADLARQALHPPRPRISPSTSTPVRQARHRQAAAWTAEMKSASHEPT